jgi:tripartite-type tricarboxylate transporter receptor subunit TctC
MKPPGFTPSPVARLNQEANKAVRDSSLQKPFLEQTIAPIGTTPAEFDAFLRAEHDKWGKVIKDAKLDLQP